MNLEQRLPHARRRSWHVPSPMQSFRRFFQLLMLWQKRIEERREMLEMSDAMLRDIGLSREDIIREANKPFWRA